MNILDRFTRDRHSRFVWGAATAGFLILGLLALAGERAALSTEERAAEDLAVEYTDTVLFDALDADLLGDEIRGRQYRDLIIQVQGGIMTDEGVARVRIWAPDGTLLFSTESLEQIGVAKAVNAEPIEAAVQGEVTSVVSDATVAAKSGLSGSTQRLFQTYAPIRVRERTAILGVAEIDRAYASISAAAADPWRTVQIGIAAAVLLCALLWVASLRHSRSMLGPRIGITPPREDVPSDPVPLDHNALRLRNELERERQANRKLQAELEATSSPRYPAEAPLSAADRAEAEAAAARLAEAEAALSEAGAHTAELERALADARAQAVAPDVLASLEERVIAAEVRAREAELRLHDLSSAPPPPPPDEPPTEPEPFAERAPAPTPSSAAPAEPEPQGGPSAAPDEPDPARMDLRSRLARTAARKKLGSHVDDEPGS